MAHDMKPNEHYSIVTLKLALATVCGDTAADALNQVLSEHVGAGFIVDFAFYNTDNPLIVKASSEPVEGELFEAPLNTETSNNIDICTTRSQATGGKRFYSNCCRFLEGIAEGIEFTADSALKVGQVMAIEPVGGCCYLLEVEEWDDDWSESFNVFG